MRRFWSLGSEVLSLDGATGVRNKVAPGHPLGTFLCEVRTADVAAVLTEPFRRVLVDPDTPPAAEAYLALHDWELDVQLHLVLPAGAGHRGRRRVAAQPRAGRHLPARRAFR
jgi:hypothetical protein